MDACQVFDTWTHRGGPGAGCLQGCHSDERLNQKISSVPVVSAASRALNGALADSAGLERLVPDGNKMAWLSVFGIVCHIA